jgi:hypothetical protein
MFFVCFLISYFVRNGFTVDDLGLLLAMVAVIILFMVLIFRAAVRSYIHSKAPCPLTPNFQRLLAWMVIPIEYRNELFRVCFVFLGATIT